MKKQSNKKAEVAMGTLIIFIAMILISAVAAAVLISSIGSIQSKALETGAATRQEIGTNMNFVEISAEAGDVLQDFDMTVRLAAGSEPVNLNDVVLSVIAGTGASEEFTLAEGAPEADEFTMSYLLEGSNHRDGYLVKGDVGRINFNLSTGLTEDESMRIAIIPKVGTPATVFATTPTTLKESGREIIFP